MGFFSKRNAGEPEMDKNFAPAADAQGGVPGETASGADDFSSRLLEWGLLDGAALESAREYARGNGAPMYKALVDSGALGEEDVTRALGRYMNLSCVDFRESKVDVSVRRLLPRDIIEQCKAVPFHLEERALYVALVEPHKIDAQFKIEDAVRKDDISKVVYFVTSPASFHHALENYFGIVETEDDMVGTARSIIDDAIAKGASDIHIEPKGDLLQVRIRIDGVLAPVATLSADVTRPLAAHLKYLADMKIEEVRVPQSKKIKWKHGPRNLDLRLSTLPTVYGEKLVMRVLDSSAATQSFEELGMEKDDMALYRDMLSAPYGMILFTGPTGSGKSSSLYASLREISSDSINIVTIEDPVEFGFSAITQVQVQPLPIEVDPQGGLTFARGLREILRQDPDVIMVGEIRDEETMQIAVRAALTGHLVFSTLHTNDAPGAVTRMMDMGVEQYLISSCLLGVVSQRLVRKLCPACREPFTPSRAQLTRLGFDSSATASGATFYRAAGCRECLMTGYRGRTGIFEIMKIDEALRDEIARHAADSTAGLENRLRKKNARSLLHAGRRKAEQGITSIEEVLRVVKT